MKAYTGSDIRGLFSNGQGLSISYMAFYIDSLFSLKEPCVYCTALSYMMTMQNPHFSFCEFFLKFFPYIL